MPSSIWKTFCSEWLYWVGGAILVFVLANTQMSGLGSGVIPDLSVPYGYDGDLLFHSWMIQRVMEGWLFENPRCGYPFGSSFLDYPGSDFGNHLVLKFLGFLGGDFQSAINLYYLLGFVVTFVAAYLVLRAFGLSIGFALAGAIIFDLSPLHFQRLFHLFYTWYFLAPLFFYLGLVCYTSVGRGKKGKIPWWLGLVLLAAASFGVYYAFFGVIVLLTSGFAGAVARRVWRPLIFSAVCAGIVAVGVFLNVMPNLVYRLAHGPNLEVAQRIPVEAELYGLKFAPLVMPRQGHRNEHLAALVDKYDRISVNGNFTVALGIIGAVGLFSLMVVIAVRLAGREVEARVSLLALIVSVLFMFGTIGGFGMLFSLFVSPLIRGWNRISVFIGFGAVTGLLMLVQIGIRRYISAPKAATVQIAVALGLVMLALYDQMTPADVASRDHLKRLFEADRAFVRNIESDLRHGAAIYQLPYIAFPEVAPINLMGTYNPGTGFLHSKTLCWSHGGTMGRPGDLFFRALSHESIARQVEVVRRLGFSGIYVDRRGYEDSGKKIVAELSAELGYGPAIEREDGQIVFFRLENVVPVSFEGMTPTEIMEHAGYVADGLGGRYEASFEDGIDFTKPSFPTFVRQMTGLSAAEPWGRWSDANVAPVVRFDFTSDLPESFVLVVHLVPFGPNAGQPMIVKVGNTSYKVMLPVGEGVLQLPVQDHNHARFIEFHPPRPTSPAELKLSSDTRRLAIAFKRLSIDSRL